MKLTFSMVLNFFSHCLTILIFLTNGPRKGWVSLCLLQFRSHFGSKMKVGCHRHFLHFHIYSTDIISTCPVTIPTGKPSFCLCVGFLVLGGGEAGDMGMKALGVMSLKQDCQNLTLQISVSLLFKTQENA